MNHELINATFCAVRTLRRDVEEKRGGAFSLHEKTKSADLLDAELKRLIADGTEELGTQPRAAVPHE